MDGEASVLEDPRAIYVVDEGKLSATRPSSAQRG